MIIYLDENMPPKLAEGLNILQQPLNIKLGVNIEVKSIKTEFGKGIKDEDWIPLAGQQGACIITQDFNMQRIRSQKALWEQNKLGMFFFRLPAKKGLTYWEQVEFCVARWQKIMEIVSKDSRPFSYSCSAKGRFERV